MIISKSIKIIVSVGKSRITQNAKRTFSKTSLTHTVPPKTCKSLYIRYSLILWVSDSSSSFLFLISLKITNLPPQCFWWGRHHELVHRPLHQKVTNLTWWKTASINFLLLLIIGPTWFRACVLPPSPGIYPMIIYPMIFMLSSLGNDILMKMKYYKEYIQTYHHSETAEAQQDTECQLV